MRTKKRHCEKWTRRLQEAETELSGQAVEMRDPLRCRKGRQVAAHAEKRRLQQRDQSFKMF
jgi:hypothetical protein